MTLLDKGLFGLLTQDSCWWHHLIRDLPMSAFVETATLSIVTLPLIDAKRSLCEGEGSARQRLPCPSLSLPRPPHAIFSLHALPPGRLTIFWVKLLELGAGYYLTPNKYLWSLFFLRLNIRMGHGFAQHNMSCWRQLYWMASRSMICCVLCRAQLWFGKEEARGVLCCSVARLVGSRQALPLPTCYHPCAARPACTQNHNGWGPLSATVFSLASHPANWLELKISPDVTKRLTYMYFKYQKLCSYCKASKVKLKTLW